MGDLGRAVIPSGACIELVKRFEGCKLEAYSDVCGVCTIGYGHTHGVELGQTIDDDEAERLLRHDLEEAGAAVSKLVRVALTQGQFDACVSFAFNLGSGTLQNSTLLRMLNAGYPDLAALEFRRWVKGRGKILPGLVKRRAAEQQLFNL